MSEHNFPAAQAHVKSITSTMITGITEEAVAMNEVVYIVLDEIDKRRGIKRKLKAEIIRIRGAEFDAQVFEDCVDVKAGQLIELSRELLSIELGPGLLGTIYDGLGNPLAKLADVDGYFLRRGSYLDTINKETEHHFTAVANIGDNVVRGQTLGVVKEGVVEHRIMVPFKKIGSYRVIDIAQPAMFRVSAIIARLEHTETGERINVTLSQKWPVKIPLKVHQERLRPHKPLATRVRIVDTMFPIAEGGTACIAGPFGSGKTIIHQSISRFSDADVVIIAACGERVCEVVETLREYPQLIDAKTGRSLMERTIIICTTSSMPVARREASIYTAITMGEYYRHMGLRVLVLADSISQWAQAMREMSGGLEEIPGEDGFPVYLCSRIAGLYERAGVVCINDKNLGFTTGSLTLIGTVSSAGENFEEPVTKNTRAVAGCFLALTSLRSSKKCFPALLALDSWSRYQDSLANALDERYFDGFATCIKRLKRFYAQGLAIGDHMNVVSEQDISLSDFVHFLKSEFFDQAFLQQNVFDEIDGAPHESRVVYLLKQVLQVIDHDFSFETKTDARNWFVRLTALFRDFNCARDNEPEYVNIILEINRMLKPPSPRAEANAL